MRTVCDVLCVIVSSKLCIMLLTWKKEKTDINNCEQLTAFLLEWCHLDVADALSQGKIRLLKNKTAEESEKPYTSEFVNELVMEMKMANNEELNKRLVKLRRRSANIEARVWCRNGVDDDLSDEELIKIALEDRGTNN